MDNHPLVFLSHSAADKSLAMLLAENIEFATNSKVRVFVSSRPDAIPSGRDWRDEVLENLDKAEVLVVLLTAAAKNSIWVGFELGYFWKKLDKSKIHILFHPKVSIPEPLSVFQGKNVTHDLEIGNFFAEICKNLGLDFPKQPLNITSIAEEARALEVDPPYMSIHNFERFLTHSNWTDEHIKHTLVWICSEDAIFQIEKGDETEDFTEEWTRKFPDVHGSRRYSVYLKIAGNIIKELTFISVDGGRYFVPMPKIRTIGKEIIGTDSQKVEFYWETTSLEYKVGQIIGRFYGAMADNLEEFAQHTGIMIE